MGANEAQVLQEVLKTAESDIIRFFVIVTVILVLFTLPLYGMIMSDRKARRNAEAARIKEESEAANTRQDKYMERERVIIDVVKENSEVIASLKSIIEKDGKTTTASLERIHNRIDEQAKSMSEQSGAMVKLQTTLDTVVQKQHSISDDIKRGFSEMRKERGTKE